MLRDVKNTDGSTAEALTANTDVYGYCDYTNDSSVTKHITVYMAYYGEDGMIKSVELSNVEALPYSRTELATDALTLPESVDNSYIKLFLWEDDLTPVCGSVKIE